MKRIAISGAQCTGKTTLLRELKTCEEFKKYTFADEVVRSLGVKINREADHNSQCTILEEHYKNSLRYDNLITDRCCVDAFTYSTYNYLAGKYTFREHKEHEELFLSTLFSYDHYFYLPPLGFLKEDGVRDTSFAYQTEIDRLFRVVYEKYRIKPTILEGSVSEKIKLFKATVL